jgi:hypothetical protein
MISLARRLAQKSVDQRIRAQLRLSLLLFPVHVQAQKGNYMRYKHIGQLVVVSLAAFTNSAVATEATKEENLKAWGKQVGTWESTDEAGNTVQTTIEKTESGAFLHRTKSYTLLAGWDNELQVIRVIAFTQDGNVIDHRWKLTKDGTFNGTGVKGQGEFTLVIKEDEMTIQFGADYKRTSKRVKKK